MKVVLLILLIVYCQNGVYSDELEDKINELTEMSLKTPVIRLNNDLYNKFVKSKVKNYSAIIMFTALQPKRNCDICLQVNEEFKLLAKSWRDPSQFSNVLFFFMVDFDDASEVFQRLRMQTAPQLWFTAPKTSVDKYDINKMGYEPDKIAKWLSDRIGQPMRVIRPIKYRLIGASAAAILVLGLLVYFTRLKNVIFSRTLWSILAVGTVLLFTSGQVWNQIRKPPMNYKDQRSGQVIYIATNNQFQLIAETMIVYGLYAAITLGILIMNSAKCVRGFFRIIVAFIGMSIVVGVFMYLLSVYKLKFGGYPYSDIPKVFKDLYNLRLEMM